MVYDSQYSWQYNDITEARGCNAEDERPQEGEESMRLYVTLLCRDIFCDGTRTSQIEFDCARKAGELRGEIQEGTTSLRSSLTCLACGCCHLGTADANLDLFRWTRLTDLPKRFFSLGRQRETRSWP